MSKQTESQDAIEEFGVELEGKTLSEQAEFIIARLPAIKRAYATRLNEVEAEQGKSIEKPSKDASTDELIAFGEERKTREHQHQVRLNTLDRLDRQITMGKVNGWEGSTIEIFQEMHSMITGNMLAK